MLPQNADSPTPPSFPPSRPCQSFSVFLACIIVRLGWWLMEQMLLAPLERRPQNGNTPKSLAAPPGQTCISQSLNVPIWKGWGGGGVGPSHLPVCPAGREREGWEAEEQEENSLQM